MKDLYRSLRMLRDHERGIKPDVAWVSATRERLLMQVSNSMPTREAVAKNRRVLARAYPNMLSLFRGPVLATLAIIGVIFGGSFASVRAAERSLPGDALYTVKLVTEQARLALESSNTEKVKLKVEFTRRRAEELKKVSQTNTADKSKRVEIAADLLKQDLNTLKEQLTSAKKTVVDSKNSADIRNVVEIAMAVDKHVVETVQVLKEANTGDLPSDVKQKVVDAEAQAADAGMRVLEVLVTATSNENGEAGMISAEDLGASVQAHATMAQGALEQAISIASSTSASLSSMLSSGSSTVTNSGTIASQAATSLGEVQILVQENKIAEAVDKLKEASTKSYLAQSEAQKESDVAVGSTSSSMVTILPEESASSTTGSVQAVSSTVTEASSTSSENQSTTTTDP